MTEKLPDCNVSIIGAGPYGLSAAAYLRAAGVETRVFGEPMCFWENENAGWHVFALELGRLPHC